jgi:di/tricarboxylate transporter
MSPAVAALAALLFAIALSFGTRINVGLPALALAWGLGAWGLGFRAEAVAALFPSSLFLTLLGVTLLFAAAESNGTLSRLAEGAVRLARGDRRVVPLLLFLVAGSVCALGPGAISTVALVAPLAMAVGARVGLPPFLSALVVANGANAGNLSPLSAVGIIANTKMAEAGLLHYEGKVFAANFLAHVAVTAIVYLVWLRRPGPAEARPSLENAAAIAPNPPPAGAGFERRQGLTLLVIGVWAVAVVCLRAPAGLSAFAAVVLLLALRAAAETEALRRTPWGPILMVSGMSTLVAVVEKAGGLELMSALVAWLSTPDTINGVIALVTGAISTWSSTSGVVLPAFLPTVPAIVSRLGGGDPLAIALSINVGASIVDVSPLSTLGALCISAVGDPEVARDLFRRLMAWGLSMILVGALLCQLLAGMMARL